MKIPFFNYFFLIFLSISLHAEEQKSLTVFAGIEGLEQAPFSMWEKGDPEPKGFDPDILRLVAKEMNIKLSFFKVNLNKGWTDLRRELLEANLVDVIAFAYTVTDERKKKVSFSQPYLVSTMNALILKDSKIKSKKDLEKLTVFAPGHTTAYKWAKKNIKGKVYADIPQGSYSSVDQLIEEKVIAAYLGDYYNLKEIAEANKKLKVLEDPLQKEELAIAVPKNKAELLVQINKALKKLKENGELEKLRKKYFETKSHENARD